MISIKHLMTDDIILKHQAYILESEFLKKLDFIKKKISVKTFQRTEMDIYLDKYSTVDGIALEKELLEFIDFLKKQYEVLENTTDVVKLRINNIFTAEPKALNEYKIQIEGEFATLSKFIKCTLGTKKNKAIKQPNIEWLELFGYDDFIESTKEINPLITKLGELKKASSLETYKPKHGNQKTKRESVIRGVASKIKGIPLDLSNSNYSEICNQVADSIEKIDTSYSLKEIHNKIIEIIDSTLEGKQVASEITVLNYPNIILGKSNWNAYEYLFNLGVTTCPYCNRQYITPIYSHENGKLRADLDHFFSKSDYPYFSMSLFNLVPSCKFCNSSLKHTKKFELDNFVHPFDNGFEQLKFSLIHKPLPFVKDAKYSVELCSRATTDEEKKVERRELNNAKVFKLETLYNYHSFEIEDIIKKRLTYDEEYIKGLIELIKERLGQSITRDEAVAFILSTYFDENFDRKALSKFIYDIAESVGLLSPVGKFNLTEVDRDRLLKLI